MALPALHDGVLPHGRWRVSLDEAHDAVSWGNTGHRQAIWDEWLQLTEALRQAVGEVPACWLAGSFFTNKAFPGDLDCVYLVDRALLDSALSDPTRAQFMHLISTGQAKAAFGLRVDSYVLPWVPFDGPSPSAEDGPALSQRGYWDYFWSKMRPTPGDPRSGCIPRRGYLEVIIDDFR